MPLFVHPRPGGIDAPRATSVWHASMGTCGWASPHEEALAVTTLVLGGVLDRHPGLDVCVSHGGGSTVWLLERMGHAATTRPWSTPACEPRVPSTHCSVGSGGTRTSAVLGRRRC